MVEIVDTNNFTQRIERQAYEIYASRGYAHGHDWEDWFEAQKMVEAQISSIDKDCIRSESFYKSSHRSSPRPSEVDAKDININPFQKDF